MNALLNQNKTSRGMAVATAALSMGGLLLAVLSSQADPNQDNPIPPSAPKALFSYTDTQTPPNWTGTGDFASPKFSDVRKMVTGEDITGTQAPYLISTRSAGKRDNQEVGTITSEAFQIPIGSALIFKHAGGSDPQNLRLTLIDSVGKELKAVTGNGSYNFVPVIWNGAAVTGKDVRIRLSDGSKGSYGFVAASDFQVVIRADLAKMFVPGRQEQLSQAVSQLKAKYNVPGVWAATWDSRIGDISAS